MDRPKTEARLKRSFARDVERVQTLNQQPGVSGEGRGIRECARRVAEFLREAGFEAPELFETKGHPVVYVDLEAFAEVAG